MSLALDWVKATETQIRGETLSCENEDAIINLFELCSKNPDTAFDVIIQIISETPEEKVLNHLGAGPLESLFFKYPEYLQKFITMTPDTDALKKCLSHVNYDAEDGLDLKLLDNFLNS